METRLVWRGDEASRATTKGSYQYKPVCGWTIDSWLLHTHCIVAHCTLWATNYWAFGITFHVCRESIERAAVKSLYEPSIERLIEDFSTQPVALCTFRGDIPFVYTLNISYMRDRPSLFWWQTDGRPAGQSRESFKTWSEMCGQSGLTWPRSMAEQWLYRSTRWNSGLTIIHNKLRNILCGRALREWYNYGMRREKSVLMSSIQRLSRIAMNAKGKFSVSTTLWTSSIQTRKGKICTTRPIQGRVTQRHLSLGDFLNRSAKGIQNDKWF